MSNVIRTAAVRIIHDLNLSPSSDPYPAIKQLEEEAQISHENARRYVKGIMKHLAEGRDPLQEHRGGVRPKSGWKKGVPRKTKAPQE